jgi:glycosidase
VNFIDNHDVARFLFTSQGDVAALRNALTLLLTEEGLPCVYYGTEQEFSGGNDPANREVMWTHGFDTTGETFTHLSRLTALRKKYEALRHGDTNVVLASDHTGAEDDAGLFAFERTGADAGSGYALVVLNSNEAHASSASISTTLPAATVLVDVLSPLQPHYTLDAGGALDATVAAQSAMVLVPIAQVVP